METWFQLSWWENNKVLSSPWLIIEAINYFKIIGRVKMKFRKQIWLGLLAFLFERGASGTQHSSQIHNESSDVRPSDSQFVIEQIYPVVQDGCDSKFFSEVELGEAINLLDAQLPCAEDLDSELFNLLKASGRLVEVQNETSGSCDGHTVAE